MIDPAPGVRIPDVGARADGPRGLSAPRRAGKQRTRNQNFLGRRHCSFGPRAGIRPSTVTPKERTVPRTFITFAPRNNMPAAVGRRRRRVTAPAVALALGLALSACSSPEGGGTATDPDTAAASATTSTQSPAATGGIGADGCVTDFTEGADYFPDKVDVEYAENFTVDYHDSYATLTVAEPNPGAEPVEETYVLVRCGAPTPTLDGDLADAQQVTVPVTSLFSGSTTQLPSLVMLDQLDVLAGVASKTLISDEQVLQRVSSPDVVEYGNTAGTIDAEKVVAEKPDVVITGGMTDPAYANIQQAGIPVVTDSDWLETNPLGRAEWIKMFGVLTDTTPTAVTEFDDIAAAYKETAQKVADESVVSVVWGAPYQGSWYVPGGNSYAATLISDAGGGYPWADTDETGSIESDVEAVFAKSGTAPVWLASAMWTSKQEVVEQNSVLQEFEAFKDDAVWNSVKDVNESGANNYYELGAARPDLVLGDLVAILHPEVLPDHDFVFFVKLS